MNTQTRKSAPVNYFGEACTLEVGVRFAGWEKGSKSSSIIYVDQIWSPEDVGLGEHPGWAPQDATEDVKTANNKAWKKYNKAELGIQSQVLKLAYLNNLLPEDIKDVMEFKFSRTAGCPCGCSKGWVKRDGLRRSIWLTIKSPKKEAERAAEKKERDAAKEILAPSYEL